jgi:hypothetical protein
VICSRNETVREIHLHRLWSFHDRLPASTGKQLFLSRVGPSFRGALWRWPRLFLFASLWLLLSVYRYAWKTIMGTVYRRCILHGGRGNFVWTRWSCMTRTWQLGESVECGTYAIAGLEVGVDTYILSRRWKLDTILSRIIICQFSTNFRLDDCSTHRDGEQ